MRSHDIAQVGHARVVSPLGRASASVLMLLTAALAVLLSISGVVAPSLAQTTTSGSSSNGLLRIGPTTIADISYYFHLLTSQDPSIFAASCSIVGNNDTDYVPFGNAFGARTQFNITGSSTAFDSSNLSNTRDTAFRANVVSDVLVTMAVMFLESTNELPFSRIDAISSAYLPTTFTGSSNLVNPAFPNVPITLNMLLMHTSSITETNFNLGEAEGPSGTVTSLADFVSSLFSPTAASIFNATALPGLSASYAYSRTNTALVSFIVERVLAASTTYASLSGIGEFVFSVILPPLGLTNTFLLNRNGQYIQTTYPFSTTNTMDMRLYKAVQDINSDGTGVLSTYPIHASYFSDYMLYTSTADLGRLAEGLFLPHGIYYGAIGSRMLATTLLLQTSSALFVVGRSPGLFLFSPNLLCAILYNAVGAQGDLPYCYFDSSSIPLGSMPFGLVATGGTSQVAVICIPLATGKTFCSTAELSFNAVAWPAGNAATAGDRAVGLAMVNLARFASDKQPVEPTTTPTPKPSYKLNGWFIFIGVVATLAVVVLAAFAADYFIQPPPPAKIVAPVMTGTAAGMRAGTSLTEGLRANNISAMSNVGGTGGAEEPVDGESPKNFRDSATLSTSPTSSSSRTHRERRQRRRTAQHSRRGRALNSDGDDEGSYADDAVNDETPYILRSINRQGGESSLRRRHHGQRPQQQRPPYQHQQQRHGRVDSEEVSSDDGSYLTPDDGWGERDVDAAERSSTGSQRPSPQGMLRFDAYI